jgi:putative addiction module CopG family antidote
MSQLQISLPEAANRFIEEQVAGGRFESPSDFVLDLVEKARIQAAKEKLAQLILEGENSGEGVEFSEEGWDARQAELQAEAARRRSA